MTRKKQLWPKVSPYRNNGGTITSFMVDLGMVKQPGSVKSRRVRYFYKTLPEAQGKAEALRIARRNEGTNSVTLPSRERSDADQALALLRPHKLSLVHVARFYLDNIHIINQQKAIGDVVGELLSTKEQDGRSGRYLRDLKFRLGTFVAAAPFSTMPIHEITAAQIDDWLRLLKSGPVDRNNYRRVISVLFGFAVKRHYAIASPLRDVEVATVKSSKPKILTFEEVRALLESATPEFLPALALGMFAGLRPESEVWRLRWEHINLEERLIDVQSSKNSASHRYVKIEDNLAQWLASYANKRGPICLSGEPYFRRMRETRERAAIALEAKGIPTDNLRDWPSDVLRHTYASYHCAAFKDSRGTSQEMGHSGSLQIFNFHYRNRVKPVDALAFWQIVSAGLPPADVACAASLESPD